MRIVVDEGVPKQLVSALNALGLDTHRFHKKWRGAKNGALIEAVEVSGYACLLTNDKNLAHQQSLTGRGVAVVALPINKRSAILQRVEDIADTLRRAKPGQHIVMGLNGVRTATTTVDGRTRVEILPRVAPFAL